MTANNETGVLQPMEEISRLCRARGVLLHSDMVQSLGKLATKLDDVDAASFAAHHPNVAVLDLSSFKCGHDAPIYSVVEQIVERSGTPYFSFKDLDENRPANTIKLRVETIDYFLKRYGEDLLRRKEEEAEIERQIAEYEQRLRQQFTKITQLAPASLV
jgi:hypothetical protein